MNSLIQLKTVSLSLLLAFLLTWLALLPNVQAITPPPDGGYPGGNTAEGTQALNSIILPVPARGGEVGALRNTANGYQTLFSLTTSSDNTATGYQALKSNTASFNSAFGGLALSSNSSGVHNSAVGWGALRENNGDDNAAVGYNALTSGSGISSTAIGSQALGSNFFSYGNTAVGYQALFSNIGFPSIFPGAPASGVTNTGIGSQALYSNQYGNDNTAIGYQALLNATSNGNIAIGSGSGKNLTISHNNIDIGNVGVAGESSTIRIGTQGTHTATLLAGIWGTPIVGGAPVVVNGNGRLGVAAIASSLPGSHSSRRLRQDTLRYEAMNTKLRTELLKEHRKLEEQERTITELKSGMNALVTKVKEQASQIQRVSAQIEVSKFATGRIRRGGPAPQLVLNNQ